MDYGMSDLPDFEGLSSPDPIFETAPTRSPNEPYIGVVSQLQVSARKRGDILAVAAAADRQFVVTTQGCLLTLSADEAAESNLTSLQQELRAGRVFCDPQAEHVVVCLLHSSGFIVESFHCHVSAAADGGQLEVRCRSLKALKGQDITAVGWLAPDGSTSGALLGTERGLFHELAQLDASPANPRLVERAFELGPLVQPVVGIHIHALLDPDGTAAMTALVLVATSSRMLMFEGRLGGSNGGSAGSPLRGLLAGYQGAQLSAAVALDTSDDAAASPLSPRPQPPPAAGPSRAELGAAAPFGGTTHAAAGAAVRGGGACVLAAREVEGGCTSALEVVWLQGLVMHILCVAKDGQDAEAAATMQSLETLQLQSCCEAATLEAASSSEPLHVDGLAVSRHHFLLLLGGSLHAISKVSRKLVLRLPLPPASPLEVDGSQGLDYQFSMAEAGPMTGLIAGDSLGGSEHWMWSRQHLYPIEFHNEGSRLWREHMELEQWTKAKMMAGSEEARDEVRQAQASRLWDMGQHTAAAEVWAVMASGSPSFEEICLRLLECHDHNPLQAFVRGKLQRLKEVGGEEGGMRCSMLAFWLLELLLDHINHALLHDSADGQEGDVVQERRARLLEFLEQNRALLEPQTVMEMLSGYGCLQELCDWAQLTGDWASAISFHLHSGKPHAALALLQRPDLPQHFLWDYGAELMVLAPLETVHIWTAATAHPTHPLDPMMVLPALMQFQEPPIMQGEAKHMLGRRAALEFLSHCIDQLHRQDMQLHNLAASLLALDPDEQPLLTYTKRQLEIRPAFDPQYVLQVALDQGKLATCMELYCHMGMHQDALDLALRGPGTTAELLEKAKRILARPEDDATRRKLWMRIARHVIPKEPCDEVTTPEVVEQLVGLIQESEGLLRIEDLLMDLPDFVKTGAFKGPLTASMNDHNNKMEALKHQQKQAIRVAEALREDQDLIKRRVAVASAQQPCALCGNALTAEACPPRSLPLPPVVAGLPQLYAFPSGLVYHGLCACAAHCQVSRLAQEELTVLLEQLHAVASQVAATRGSLEDLHGDGDAGDGGKEASADSRRLAELRQRLDLVVGAECPRNGEVTLELIDRPFLEGLDSATIASWHVGPPEASG